MKQYSEPDRLLTIETSSSDDSFLSEGVPTFSYSKTRHYYTSNHRFEQSVDVYRPNFDSLKEEEVSSKGIVALVVGSGWLGHQPWVYWGTSWWNSSLPKQISSLGYTCVVIRHSGGFPRISSLSWTTVVTMLLVVHLMVYGILKHVEFPGDDNEGTDGNAFRLQMVMATFVACFWYIFWYWQGQGAATLKDMLYDVSTALNHVDKHIVHWHGGEWRHKTDDKLPIIFGGYSSGAHVAATLLSNPSLTPLPTEDTVTKLESMEISHILYVSGFLCVSPKDWITTFLTLVVLGEWPSNVPSPLQHLKSRGGGVLKAFGKARPHPQHTLIGCQHEVFGLPILNSAFCSDEYVKEMNKQSEGSAEWIPLNEWTCNHWSVLSSMSLRKALHKSLEKVFEDI